MAKDPAFLFYSTDFYEGTRTMLPEERACYVDLMIYQHQRGPIPNDLKRVLLYCNGISEATLKATLQAKFKLTDKGWLNMKLQEVIEQRQEYSEKQSINGTIGQFWKKAKAILKDKDYTNLYKSLSKKDKKELYETIKDMEVSEATLKAMLKATLKHLEIENENENENIDINKEGVQGEKNESISTSVEQPLSNRSAYPFDEFWNDYEKKVGDKEKIRKKYDKLPDRVKLAIKEHIPKYKAAQPEKQFRKNPETYLNNKSWNDEIIAKVQIKTNYVEPYTNDKWKD